MSAFIINTNTNAVVGFVQNIAVASEKAGQEHLVVNEAKDLEGLSLQQMTDMYNALSGEAPVGKFKVAKSAAATKVFALLSKLDTTTLTQLDAEAEKVVEEKAKEIQQQEVAAATIGPDGKKVRKVRDSKLQRMKSAFLTTNEDGSYKQWTVKELMEKCGTSERITHVYISILRSPSDRFVLNIEKLPVEAGTPPQFMYKPKTQTAEPAQDAPAA
jgi:hypothetical protein